MTDKSNKFRLSSRIIWPETNVLNYVRVITDDNNNVNVHKITATCIALCIIMQDAYTYEEIRYIRLINRK